ncbi:hypothetical protein BX616_007182, partial [Lobosporangium transversale]
MMMKSTFAPLFLLVALIALSTTQQVKAQDVTPTTTPTTTANADPVTSGSGSKPTITGAPSVPEGNFTTMPNFSSLATMIASYATGRSVHPGNAPTSKPSPSSAAASSSLLTEASRSSLMAGMALVIVTTLMSAIGT